MHHSSLTWKDRFLDSRLRGNDGLRKGLQEERELDSRFRCNDGGAGVVNGVPTEKPTLVSPPLVPPLRRGDGGVLRFCGGLGAHRVY